MIPAGDLVLFAAAALIMVLTPGPLARNRLWLAAQRYVMGGVLGALAARLAFEERPQP